MRCAPPDGLGADRGVEDRLAGARLHHPSREHAALREPHLDAVARLALADRDRSRAARLVSLGEGLDRPAARRHVLEHERAVFRVERLTLVRPASASRAAAHHEAHPALRVGLIAHLEVAERAAAVAVDHAAADLAGAVDGELDAVGRRHDARLARAEAGTAHRLQLVALAGRQALEQEDTVGPARLLGAVRSGPERPTALARAARDHQPAGGAVAALVVQHAADRRSRLQHQLERLAGALLRDLDRVDARAREARPPRADRVLARLQPAELEAAVGAGLAPHLVAGTDHLHLHAAAARRGTSGRSKARPRPRRAAGPLRPSRCRAA